MRSSRYAPAMSVLALVLTTGTGAWALALPRNSVRSATIVNGQVKARDLAAGAVSGAKIANGSLVPSVLAPGVAHPGAKGPPGTPGRPGDGGAPGAPAVSRQALTLAAPVTVGVSSVPLTFAPSAYQAEPGNLVVLTGTVSVTLVSGSCPSSSHLNVHFVAGHSSATAAFGGSGRVALSGGGFVDPGGAATVAVAGSESNECAGTTWTVDAANIDIVHVN
jgi:hypothetical protein